MEKESADCYNARVMPKFAERIIAMLGGFLFAIFAIEAGLRTAGAIAAGRAGDEVREGDASRPVVAFCGDSNIYGVYVTADQTLPKVVERLSRRGGEKGVKCLNFGVPGASSWTTVDQVRRATLLKPKAIIVRCGVNNYSVVPPGRGLGPIENLNIVKFIRRSLFNAKVESLRGNAMALQLGPAETKIEGFQVATDTTTGAISIIDREGKLNNFSNASVGRELNFNEVAPRLRADLLEMANGAASVGAKPILLTYLAGEIGAFSDISALMRKAAADANIPIADVAPELRKAVLDGDSTPFELLPFEKRTCRQSAFLTSDLHPTAAGYEIEGRVLLNLLKTEGIAPAAPADDPTEAVRAVSIKIPVLQQIAGGAPEGYIKLAVSNAQKDDIIKFFVGEDGEYFWKNLHLPIRILQFERASEQFSIGAMRVLGDDAGGGSIHLPRELLRALRKPVKAMCVVDRGGAGGGAQRYPSALVEIDPEK